MKILGIATSIIFFVTFLALALLLLGSIVPVAGGYQIRIVESGSMAPTIPLGSALVVSPSETYSIGDVVTFQRVTDDEVTTHRIIGEEVLEGKAVFIMQGDANNAADQRPVEKREIVGKVVFHIPYLGFILDFLRKPLGFMLIVGVPAIWILYEQVLKIIHEARKQKKTDGPTTTS